MPENNDGLTDFFTKGLHDQALTQLNKFDDAIARGSIEVAQTHVGFAGKALRKLWARVFPHFAEQEEMLSGNHQFIIAEPFPLELAEKAQRIAEDMGIEVDVKTDGYYLSQDGIPVEIKEEKPFLSFSPMDVKTAQRFWDKLKE